MRILNIFFKNINSLEGENRIDFTQPPFSDTGVFAITGPNGSGKSTVLDAITLGLYGETFRFDKPATHVMTKHTNECFAVIEFSLGIDRYQSSWRVEQVAGQLQPAMMQLIRPQTGEVLAATPQQVCASITEITGMNFRNFTRSILLAQGDFAAFLNALDAERIDILEKIISTDIYGDYKQQVIHQAEQVQHELSLLKQHLATISLLPAEQQEALEHDLIDYQEQAAALRGVQNDLKQQQTAIKNVDVVQARINTQKRNLKHAKTQLQQLEQQLEQLNANQNALAFQEQVALIDAKNQAISASKTSLLALQSELVQLKNKLARDKTPVGDVSHKNIAEQQQLISQLKTKLGQLTANGQSEATLARSLEIQLAEKKAALGVLATWLQDHAADELLLTQFPDISALKNAQAVLLQLNGQQKAIAKQVKDSRTALLNNSTALEREQKKLADASAELAADEQELTDLLAVQTLEQVETLRDDQQQRVKSFQELGYLAAAYQRLSKSGGGLLSFFSRKKDTLEVNIDDLSREHEELKKEVLREENIKTLLEQAVLQESLLKKMLKDRVHLVDGKPCYLCGALQHPYSIKPPMLKDSQQALNNQNIKIKNLLARTYDIGRQLESAQQQTERKQSNRTRRQRISSQWLSLCNRLNTVRPDLSIENIELMKELLELEIDELKNITALAARYRHKQSNIGKLNTTINTSTANIERLQATIPSLTATLETQAQQQLELENTLQQQQQAEQALQDQVLNQLALLGEKMPSKDKDDGLFNRLTARKQEYQSMATRHDGLIEDIAVLSAKQKHCETEINACKTQLDDLTAQLQTEEGLSLHLAVIEKQQLIADKERQMQAQDSELATIQHTLQQNLQGTAFASLSALHDILALLQRQPQLEQQLVQLRADIAAKTQEMEKTGLELEADFKLAEAALSPDELNVQLKHNNEQTELTNMEIQRLQKQLTEQKKAQQNQAALLAQLQQQEKIAEPHLAELALLNEENGRVFRRRVQQQLADKLLAQTNSILEKISGRYYVRQLPSEQGLALIIEDTLQGNAQRLPKTLSGGESFVVSLALALGLSEIANNGRSVDSLFLDEGFGNLDAETLYTIISTLENLHTQGKMVGVISHVEAVQKRFKAQLHIVKKPNGMGMLQKAS